MSEAQDSDGGASSAQLTELDCPSCEDVVDARYLGTASTDEHSGHIAGWECTECGAELQEHVDHRGSSFDLRVVEDSEDEDESSGRLYYCPDCADHYSGDPDCPGCGMPGELA